jgi:NosR/NirI family nitrous oxide reductase transcriptional regulator
MTTGIRRRLVALAGAMLLAAAVAPDAAANGRLAEFLGRVAPGELIAGADRFGPPEGDPPVAQVYQGDRLLGVAWLNSDVVDAAGYSGKPIHIIVALDAEDRLAGARLIEHHEPIVLVGIPEEKIRAVIDHFKGMDLRAVAAGRADAAPPEIVSGATVTVLVIGDSILRSALKILQARGGGPAAAAAAAGATAPAVTTVDLGR